MVKIGQKGLKARTCYIICYTNRKVRIVGERQSQNRHLSRSVTDGGAEDRLAR
jgi:hypothetical protein